MMSKTSPLLQKARFTINQQGFSLIEILLGVSIFALLVMALVGALIYGKQSTALSGARARAVLTAEEGLEAVRNIRDEDFTNLIDGTHGLGTTGNQWGFDGISDVVDIFTREIEITDIDATTKQVTSTVTWQQNAQRTGTVSLITYLTNWMLPGTPTLGDWANPLQEGGADISGDRDGYKIQVQGDYAYVIRTGDNPDFIIIDVSDTLNPVIVGSLNLSGGPREIAVSGDYAYVASSSNNQELQVIDVSTPAAPSVVETYNAAGNADGRGVIVQGNTVYMSRSSSGDDEFLILDITTPTAVTLIGSTDLGSSTNYQIAVLGSHAYVVSSNNSQELKIVDISTPASPSFVQSYNFTGNANAWSIVGFDTTVVVGRSNGDMYIMDISTPTSPSQVGIFDAQDDVRDMSLGNDDDYVFIASDENSAELQVVDISTPVLPALVGSLNVSADLNGIAYDADKDKAFAVGDSNSEELVIFVPQ